MAEKQYLYGAAVQGIQGFIFQTNELKDIVGASELVENICSQAFDEFTEGEEDRSIIRAAGNIKHVFSNKDKCRKAVREFPKKVVEMAPGITISQAVVEFDSNEEFPKAIEQLENHLRAQRNKPMRSTTLGFMGIQRSRKTGLPEAVLNSGEYIDLATSKKREARKQVQLAKKCFGMEKLGGYELPFDIEKMTLKNDWIAIIHADGNGLGQIVQKVGNDKQAYKEFSKNLELATTLAAQDAFSAIDEEFQLYNHKMIPVRPIVLGGDDFTAICRGDLALRYTEEFLKAFEKRTGEKLGKTLRDKEVFGRNGAECLSACAGIAFIKSSYPFYYGYGLAETLCDRAKKDAKTEAHKAGNRGLAPSCVMMHKVQDSFVENFDSIAKRELTTATGKTFEFGPYYLADPKDSRHWTIANLREKVKLLDSKDGNAAKSHLRRWLSAMTSNEGHAYQLRLRMLSIFSKKYSEVIKEITDEKLNAFPVYDMLSLFSVLNQETKNNQDE